MSRGKASPAMARAVNCAIVLGASATPEKVASAAKVPYRLAVIAVRKTRAPKRQ